jgi:three-Cys-motif partner protein
MQYLIKEPSANWGGIWTESKLEAFSKYVSAYLTILKKNPQWQTIYFDGFAGSGSKESAKNNEIYKQLSITEEEQKVYRGSAERVLALPEKLSFDWYYFVDLKEESLIKLESKLSIYQKKCRNPFQFKPGDCNKWVLELSKTMKNSDKYAALVFLDPFGMQINWESIESLRSTRTDIWILVPTGVIVNRLLDRKGKLRSSVKLESFFGISEKIIREHFYHESPQMLLFENENADVYLKVSQPVEKIAELYTNRLKTVWKYVTEEPLVLKNKKGVPIFHFIFASNNPTAKKIAKEIIIKSD